MIFKKILLSFLSWCPGAAGILLRQKLYPLLLGCCGKNVLIGRYVSFSNPDKISLADGVIINDHTSLKVCGDSAEARLILESGVFVGVASSLVAENDTLKLLQGCNLGSNCEVVARNPVTIEENVLLAAYCVIGKLKANPEASPEINQRDQSTVVGSGSWLGVRTLVVEGVHIGNDSIVGAHSIVESDLTPYCIAFGQPAQQVAHRLDEK